MFALNSKRSYNSSSSQFYTPRYKICEKKKKIFPRHALALILNSGDITKLCSWLHYLNGKVSSVSVAHPRKIQCDNMYISIFSQHNYIYFLLCVLQHYMFRPSVWAIIRCVWRLSHTMHGGGGRGFVGGGARSRYVGLLIM